MRRGAASLLLVTAVSVVSCTNEVVNVDVARARAHVDMLAATIGSRPIGSPANSRARAYLLGQLQQYGFVVRVQEQEAVDSVRGVTAHVANIIALREGQTPDAVALVAHYDSVPQAGGAIDDALGVATCLESARVLSQDRLRRSLFVLLTDGEEVGLMGARAVAGDPQVSSRMRAFLNFDGPAGAGTPMLFEAGPGWGTPLDAWARQATTPRGASFAVEIYKRLPNDTDFSVLKSGAAGLNFAPLGDAYAYHTDRDVPRRVETETLRRGVENTVAIVRALDNAALESRPDTPTFFDLGTRRAVIYGPRLNAVVAWAAVAIGAVVWLLLTLRLWRQGRWSVLLATPLWSALAAASSIGAALAFAWLLRAARTELNPWYAFPHWFFASMAAAGLTAAWLVAWLARSVPVPARPMTTPAAVWWVTLPPWAALTCALQVAAPAASYLAAWPLLSASALLVLCWRSVVATRVASLSVLAVVAMLWAEKTLTLLTFLVPLSGWLGVVMPVWVYPAMMAAAAIVLAPPLAAASMGWRSRRAPSRLVGPALAGCFLLTAAGAYVSPAYTADRPERRSIRYVQDDKARQAWWQLGGNEPAVNLRNDGPEGASWQRIGDNPPATTKLPMAGAFKFRTRTRPMVARPPADVSMTTSVSAQGRQVVQLFIVARENATVRVVAPAGRVPLESNLAGSVTDGEWSATYVAAPPSGINVRLAFEPPLRDDERPLVVLTVPGLPGGTGPLGLLPWLPQERATWDARSVHVVNAPPDGR